MRNNIVSIGARTITGDMGKVIAAGEVNITDADVEKLTGAGEVYMENCYIGETKLAGEVTAKNSNFGIVRLAGEMILKDLSHADTMIVIGELYAESLECRILRNFSNKSSDTGNQTDNRLVTRKTNYNNGSVFNGNFKAETFENLCDFSLDFQYQFKNILSTDMLHYTGIAECEEFYSFGPLDMEGVNAEFIYIHPLAVSNLKQVMGSEIRITDKFPLDQTFKLLPKSADLEVYLKAAKESASIMNLDLIEGDNITLNHVNAKKVCGEYVSIGENCTVDYVEYKEKLDILPGATIKEIIQL